MIWVNPRARRTSTKYPYHKKAEVSNVERVKGENVEYYLLFSILAMFRIGGAVSMPHSTRRAQYENDHWHLAGVDRGRVIWFRLLNP